MHPSVVAVGDGWCLLVKDEVLIANFNHAPDGRTLERLRRCMRWDPGARVWETPDNPNIRRHVLVVLRYAQTWESVGETPWDPMEDDGMIF